MATLKVQLKTSGGDDLMPKTLSELVYNREIEKKLDLTKTGTTSGYFWTGQFSPALTAGSYRLELSASVAAQGDFKVVAYHGSTSVSNVGTFTKNSTAKTFYFTVGVTTVNQFQIQAKRATTWHFEVYKETETSFLDELHQMQENADTMLLTLVKDSINLCTIDGLIKNGYMNNNYAITSDNNYDCIKIILQPGTTYSLWRNNISGKTRLFSPAHESFTGVEGDYTFTTGDAEYYELYVGCLKSSGDYTQKIMVVEGSTKPSYFVPWYNVWGTNYAKDIADLKGTVSPSYFQMGMLLNTERQVVKALCCNNKNILHVHIGSSSSAWQASDNLAPEGVCEVPATCDRQGLAYGLWKNCVFGNPQYRRYDYGKHSLVGNYCDKWEDDTNAFFTESGTWDAAYGNFTNAASSRTTLDTQVSPIPFDSAGSDMHIPRRYSNDSASSVSFTIPAGYSRFSFLYTNNILGDDVTITVSRGNGVVTMSKYLDMADAVDANGGTFSTLYTGTASYIGYPNQMIHFAITDTSAPTTITITKSSDTTKYLIYWGVVYYATATEPYAHIFANNSRGGATGQTLQSHRAGIVGVFHPDLVTYQITTANNISSTPTLVNADTIIGFLSDMVTYCSGLGADIAFCMQHRTKGQSSSAAKLEIVKDIYGKIIRYLKDNNLQLIGNIANLFDKIHECYYSDKTYYQFVSQLSADNTHLNTAGLSIYKALFTCINHN